MDMEAFMDFYFNITNEDNGTDLLEKLSELEHNQWMDWAKSLMEQEKLSKERVERWKKLFIPYKDLPDSEKESDRIYARKILDVFNKKELKTEGRCANQNFIQGKALQLLAGDNPNLILKLIDIYGHEFRKIIDEFECRLGKLPSANDLIWIAGVHTGKDPRKVAKELEREI